MEEAFRSNAKAAAMSSEALLELQATRHTAGSSQKTSSLMSSELPVGVLCESGLPDESFA